MRLADAALDLAQRGIAVFPLQPREKKPYGFTTGLLMASCDVDVIASWWAGETPLPLKPDEAHRRPVYASAASNVALATGKPSGFWVLDLDGPVAEAGLATLIEVHGPLPETPEQKTPGGRHLLFALDPRFDIRNSASKIGPKIDVRGTGGYIVAPPSIHPGDVGRGIPPGIAYAWCARRALGELPIAAAPDWLLRLAAPDPTPSTPAKPLHHTIRDGRATKWGDACLATSCRAVASARPGNRRMAVFNYAAFLGGLVSGGEVERGYAKASLIAAGMAQSQDKAWRPKDLETLVENGLLKGQPHPQTAPEPKDFRGASPRTTPKAATPAEAAVDVRDARALWRSARPADCGAVRTWLKIRGLEPRALPGVLERMRAHAGAPVAPNHTAPAMLIPLTAGDDPDWPKTRHDEVDAIAVIPLQGDHDRPTHFVGDRTGKVALLSSWPADGSLLIALELADLWALGANATENGHDLGLVLAPSLRAFAGGFLGDKYGRADPATPYADPDEKPWTAVGERTGVFLAVRGDLRTPELRTRRTYGGTRREAVQGDAAARFYGGLAEQAWRRAGAAKVQIMRSAHGEGFSG